MGTVTLLQTIPVTSTVSIFQDLIMFLSSPFIKPFKNKVLTVRSYHVTYKFQSESTVYNCLNVHTLYDQLS